MAIASLEETLTVTGESPVIDRSATRIQQNFKLDQLQSIPNRRDMWALLAATPGVVMGRIDIGGNRAGTQTGYTAYGLNRQVRTSVEGINTTEGTDGAGFTTTTAPSKKSLWALRGRVPKPPLRACSRTFSGSPVATGLRRVLCRRLQQLVPGLEPDRTAHQGDVRRWLRLPSAQ
jgi:hypothetical protein